MQKFYVYKFAFSAGIFGLMVKSKLTQYFPLKMMHI